MHALVSIGVLCRLRLPNRLKLQEKSVFGGSYEHIYKYFAKKSVAVIKKFRVDIQCFVCLLRCASANK